MRPPPVDAAQVHPDGQSLAALHPCVQKLPAPVGKHNPDPQSEFLVHDTPTDNPELGHAAAPIANAAHATNLIKLLFISLSPARSLRAPRKWNSHCLLPQSPSAGRDPHLLAQEREQSEGTSLKE
jgi:hypothetical protein